MHQPSRSGFFVVGPWFWEITAGDGARRAARTPNGVCMLKSVDRDKRRLRQVGRGLFPKDMELIGRMVTEICCYNFVSGAIRMTPSCAQKPSYLFLPVGAAAPRSEPAGIAFSLQFILAARKEKTRCLPTLVPFGHCHRRGASHAAHCRRIRSPTGHRLLLLEDAHIPASVFGKSLRDRPCTVR